MDVKPIKHYREAPFDGYDFAERMGLVCVVNKTEWRGHPPFTARLRMTIRWDAGAPVIEDGEIDVNTNNVLVEGGNLFELYEAIDFNAAGLEIVE